MSTNFLNGILTATKVNSTYLLQIGEYSAYSVYVTSILQSIPGWSFEEVFWFTFLPTIETLLTIYCTLAAKLLLWRLKNRHARDWKLYINNYIKWPGLTILEGYDFWSSCKLLVFAVESCHWSSRHGIPFPPPLLNSIYQVLIPTSDLACIPSLLCSSVRRTLHIKESKGYVSH